MPNAKTVPTPSSNNQNNANPISSENRMRMINTQGMHIEPMHNRSQMELIQPQERLNWGLLSSSIQPSTFQFQPQPQMDLIQLNLRMLSSRSLSECLANQQRQDFNPNDELLRFIEDDIDSNIDFVEFALRFSEDDNDSNSDSDDGFPGLIDANGMPFDD